jgi:hypothetical protein
MSKMINWKLSMLMPPPIDIFYHAFASKKRDLHPAFLSLDTY